MSTLAVPISTEDTLLAWRDEFPILASTTYLISHSLGPMPRRAAASLAEFADTWATRGIRAWAEGWWDMPVTVGDLIGRIIGAPPSTVVMHQNVSICQAIVLSCFPWSGPRNKLVTDGLNFPSNDYIYGEFATHRNGPHVVSVTSADGMTLPLEQILEAIDEQTQLVSISHVAFRSSYLHDLAAITQRAHAVGAMVLADLYQSAGIVPLDVTALSVDFAVGGSVKWLLGGPGAGFLYVRPDLIDTLRPAFTGWAAHAEPFAFAPAPIVFDRGIRRFLNGTPGIPALYSARSGYQIVAEIGVEAIRAKSQRQTQRLIDQAHAAGFSVCTVADPNQRGGVVILDIPNSRAVTDELTRRNILVDFRPGAGIRIAPHFYTTDQEIDHILTHLRDITRQDA